MRGADASGRTCGPHTPRLAGDRGRRGPLRGLKSPPPGARTAPTGGPRAQGLSEPRTGTGAQGWGQGQGGRARAGRGAGGGAGTRPRRRPGLRAGPELTFVLGHQPLERRPRHRPGNSCAVRPRLRSARILPPAAGAASGSPAGHRSPSGARGARAQWRAGGRRALGGRGGSAVAPRSATRPLGRLVGLTPLPAAPIPVGPWFPQDSGQQAPGWVRSGRLCRHTGRRSVRGRTARVAGRWLRAARRHSGGGSSKDPRRRGGEGRGCGR